MKKFVLVHPRLMYRRQGAYLQNSLLVLQGQLRHIYDVVVVDELIEPLVARMADIDAADVWGVTCMGSSSIPEAIRVGQWLRRLDAHKPIFVGGQVVSRLSDEAFARIFATVTGVRRVRNGVRCLRISGAECF